MSEVTQRQRAPHLLIVEDDQAQLRTLTAIMQDEGFEVIGCSTAAAALEQVEREDIGVAVLDLRLPDLSGTELLEKLRERDSRINIVINTAYASLDSARDAVNLGAFAYVEKAGDPEELIRHVYRAFRARLVRYTHDLEEAVAEQTRDLQTANQMLRREITERKRAEEALQYEQQLLQILMDSVPDTIYFKDRESCFTRINRAQAHVLGLEHPDQAVGKHDREFFPRELADQYHADEQRVITTGEPLIGSIEAVTRADGERRWVSTTKVPIRNANDEIVGTVGISRDITERREAEERAREHLAELTHVARLSTMGEMAAGIAHELNQPLSAILNYAEGVRLGVQSGKRKAQKLGDDLEAIAAEAQRAGEIIRRLRSFVRKRQPRRSSLDLNELVPNTVRFVESEARINDIRLRVELTAGLPKVLADPTLIQQVVLNLVRNGIEALGQEPAGQRELTVSTALVGGDTVAVAVCDTGRGLPGHSPDELFTPFFTTKPEGLGLGLSISRSIIEAEGGRLMGSPNPDRGMTFRFTLPACLGDPDDRA